MRSWASQSWGRHVAVACVGAGLTSSISAQPVEMAAGDIIEEPVAGIAFVAVSGGCFEMGDIDVGLVGRVCLAPFLIARTEVTNAQYRALVPDHSSGSRAGQDLDGDVQPVVNVSHDEAVAFARGLADATGWAIRLPTEAEWEYAARAGSTTARPWGPDIEQAHRFANLQERPGDYRLPDPYVVTAPVASLESNAFGLFDMMGNAAEWVLDAYAPGADRYGDVRDDPLVTAETPLATSPLRVRRGGSFEDPASLVSSAARDFYASGFRLPQTGFRLVAEPPREPPIAAAVDQTPATAADREN